MFARRSSGIAEAAPAIRQAAGPICGITPPKYSHAVAAGCQKSAAGDLARGSYQQPPPPQHMFRQQLQMSVCTQQSHMLVSCMGR